MQDLKLAYKQIIDATFESISFLDTFRNKLKEPIKQELQTKHNQNINIEDIKDENITFIKIDKILKDGVFDIKYEIGFAKSDYEKITIADEMKIETTSS
ncbi:MAG: hypothetical protein ACQBVK_01790 [Candidatus Phytoplasma sp. TWB_XP]